MKTKNRIANVLMVVGALLFLAGAGLFAWNQQQAQMADQASDQLLPAVMEAIAAQEETIASLPEMESTASTAAPERDFSMTEVEMDGYAYIGYLSIPALELDLPVMAQWDYPRLRVAPCRYNGTTKGDDLVIVAHNYKRHFGKISTLNAGDTVLFTDMDGETTVYEVVALDVLSPTAVEEMIAGEYDLTLFTCTYGGKSRVTLRCDRVEN